MPKKIKKDRGLWLWFVGLRLGALVRKRPKFQLWSRLSEKCPKKLRRTVVCGFGLRLRTLLRTRPEELKFQLSSRLSEKCQKKLRRTVVCGCGLRLRTPQRTKPEELKFQLWSILSEKCQKKLRRTVVCGCGL